MPLPLDERDLAEGARPQHCHLLQLLKENLDAEFRANSGSIAAECCLIKSVFRADKDHRSESMMAADFPFLPQNIRVSKKTSNGRRGGGPNR